MLLFMPAVFAADVHDVYAYPDYYRVHGVQSNDTLSVRRGPSSSSRKIGDLAPDASPVEVVGIQGGWARITTPVQLDTDDEFAEAWVSKRYLKKIRLPRLGDSNDAMAGALPVGLECIGAWPGWNLEIKSSKRLVFGGDVADIHGYAILESSPYSAQRPPVIKARSESGALLTGIFRSVPGACSVGMEGGNHTYSYQSDVIIVDGGKARTYHGCCLVPSTR